MHLSEQEIIRRQAKEELEKLGINPYPADHFEVNVSAREILENYPRHKSDYRGISIAGRIMSRRIMGSASFAEFRRMKPGVFRSMFEEMIFVRGRIRRYIIPYLKS